MIKFNKETILPTAIVIIICLIWLFWCVSIYRIQNDGGWYCEYCHQGSIVSKHTAESILGHSPCKCSEDSCHHFVYYFTKPESKPKYVK